MPTFDSALQTGAQNAARNAATNFYVDSLDTGSGTAVLEIYSASFGALLISFSLPNPAFGNSGTSVVGQASANGVPIAATAVAGAPTEASACRVKDRNGDVKWSASGAGAVGISGSGAEVEMSDVNVSAGLSYNLTSWILTTAAPA
jgi:hypothetical protein